MLLYSTFVGTPVKCLNFKPDYIDLKKNMYRKLSFIDLIQSGIFFFFFKKYRHIAVQKEKIDCKNVRVVVCKMLKLTSSKLKLKNKSSKSIASLLSSKLI